MTDPTILLVDDENEFVDTVTKRLAKRNIQVIKALGGMEAINRLENCPEIDAVVLDVKMPGMDGLETLAIIKEKRPHVEVIILTGNATTESAIEFMKRGAFDYLMKPCDVDLLVEKLKEAVTRSNSPSRTRNTGPAKTPGAIQEISK